MGKHATGFATRAFARLRSLVPRLPVVSMVTANPPPKTADSLYLSPEWRALVASIIAERGRICEDRQCPTPVHGRASSAITLSSFGMVAHHSFGSRPLPRLARMDTTRQSAGPFLHLGQSANSQIDSRALLTGQAARAVRGGLSRKATPS